MKKDSRFWILVGAVVVVAGLFLAFLWSVMAAPSEPTIVQTNAVTETTNTAEPAMPGGDKPAEPSLEAMAREGEFNGFSNPVVTPPPPPDTDALIREAEQAAERARAQAAQAEAQARAQANRALERARQQTQRARQRARPQPAGDKPEDDGKPPEDW
jgi:type IV secretory pathway VirB10-like protein